MCTYRHVCVYIYVYVGVRACLGLCAYARASAYTHETKISCRALFNILHPVSKLPLPRAPLILTLEEL